MPGIPNSSRTPSNFFGVSYQSFDQSVSSQDPTECNPAIDNINNMSQVGRLTSALLCLQSPLESSGQTRRHANFAGSCLQA